jgi:diguanylate cyclase (GGDEF)-like protein
VRNSYGEINTDWTYDSWGAITEMDHIYNVSMIVELKDVDAVIGYKGGKPFTPNLETYFGGKLAELIGRFGENKLAPETQSEIIQTQDGLAAVAVAPILPISKDVQLPQAQPRYLLLARFLTDDFVAKLGQTYVVDALTIKPTTSAVDGQFQIRAQDNTVIATANWQDRRPGDTVSSHMLPLALGALTLLILSMTTVGAFCWRLVSQLARQEESARHDSLHDALTGLPNRKSLKRIVDGALAERIPDLALAFVDLDGFKEVNDTYDHATGDKLIKIVATAMTEMSNKPGQVHRLGGDEFVACFVGHGARAEAELFAEAVLKFVAQPFNIEGRMAVVGASIGIANSFGEDMTSNELMRRADVAMYRAKNAGKNRFVHFFNELETERKISKAILDALRLIIENDALDVAYMPIVDSKSGTIRAVEALARWPQAYGSPVSPDTFVAIAESNGCIDALSRSMLSKACRTVKAWPEIRLCVNISPIQFNNPAFVDETIGIILENGFDPSRVELEITEGTLLQDMPRVKAAVSKLRAAGLKVALDDFGKGYSSFHYLHELQFDRIKIDRSLTARISEGYNGLLVVQGAVTMAKGLCSAITAEGVETEEQMTVLALAGCSEMQGYYFSSPTSAPAITQMLVQAKTSAA